MPAARLTTSPRPARTLGGPRPARTLGVAMGTAALAVSGVLAIPQAHADDVAPRLDGVLSLEPGELDFGRVEPGGRVDAFVTARNNGNGPLVFSGTTLLGAQARDFGLLASGAPPCVIGLELGPGGFCEIGLRFAPSAGGVRTATLSVTASGQTRPTRLVGAGAAATGGADTTAPRVTSLRPADRAKNVGRDVTVSAGFSEDVRGVGRASYTLTDLRTRRQVPARIVRDGRRWRLDPTGRLSAGRSYRVRLTGAIRDAAGNALAPRTWRFTTRG